MKPIKNKNKDLKVGNCSTKDKSIKYTDYKNIRR